MSDFRSSMVKPPFLQDHSCTMETTKDFCLVKGREATCEALDLARVPFVRLGNHRR